MLTIDGIDGLRAHLGQELGVSNWAQVSQPEIDAFANATGDFYWIHVDPSRARETAFGSTIAHGLMTLSLGPGMSNEIYEVSGFRHLLNYGYESVRFPAPVPVGSRVRMRATLLAIDEQDAGVRFTVAQTFEREGSDKPVCVAQNVWYLVPLS
ncbi:MAG TPA: MaoC family dehydratase [Solirubrobacteraceae bacterium]